MKLVVFDPSLSRFGHHVQFNTQLLELLEFGGIDVVYLDVENIVQSKALGSSAKFVQLTPKDIGGSGDGKLTSKEFIDAQKSEENCKALWARIEGLEPDLVLVSSEGTWRKQLLGTVPGSLTSKVYPIVHPLWSVINQLDNNPTMSKIYNERIAGMFVLETFLVDKMSFHGIPTFWFPHRGFAAEHLKIPAKTRKDTKALQLGTVGVLNERRNHKFLIDAMAGLDDLSFDFKIAGQLMPKVQKEIQEAVQNFEETPERHLDCEFGYLEDARFSEILSGLDLAILAYDDQRSLQASGAVFSFAEHGVPLLVPDTELFRHYKRQMPDLVHLYSSLNPDSLRDAVRAFAASDGHDPHKLREARDLMIARNDRAPLRAYLKQLLPALAGLNKKSVGPDFRHRARVELSKDHAQIAEGYLLAAMELEPKDVASYEDCVRLREKIGDAAGASHIRTKHLMLDQTAYPDQTTRPIKPEPFEILVWPAFSSRQEMDDFQCRMAWHAAPLANFVTKVHMFVEDEFDHTAVRNPVLADAAREKQGYFIGKIQVHPKAMFEKGDWKKVRFSYVWRYNTPEERKLPFPKGKNTTVLYSRQIWRVDEENERFATSVFLKSGSESCDMEGYRKQSHESFKKLAARFTKNHIAVFGTGPSLSDAWNHDFSEVDTIAANSMVKNIGLLDHLQPKLIVCADPIFHGGVSTYAEEFRQHLRFALHRYGCSLMVPERDRHIYEQYFEGEGFDIFSAPLVHTEKPNYDMLNDFHVKTTGNILTLFLLQVAFSIAKTVDIYGCDGRPLHENSYFWGHDKSAQLNDHMTDIQRAHPGFFKISYDEYYEEHCTTLESFLAHAEELKKTPQSQTFSYIPALIAREVDAGVSTKEAAAPVASMATGLSQISASLLLQPQETLAKLSAPGEMLDTVERLLKLGGPEAQHFKKVKSWVEMRDKTKA